MTYRGPPAPPTPLERPPQLFGFALYLAGVGSLLMGVGLAVVLALMHGKGPFSMVVVSRWSIPLGQLMVLLGLAVSWRVLRTSHRRLLAVAATLWVTMFVAEMQRAQIREYLSANAPGALSGTFAATLTAWAIVMGLLAVVVHDGGRAFAARTWATTLGACLLAAHAFEHAWPVVVPHNIRAPGESLPFIPPQIGLGAAGFLVMGGALLAAGRTILQGVTVAEYVRARGTRASADGGGDESSDGRTQALVRGLPLLADAMVALFGMALAASVAAALSHTSSRNIRALLEAGTVGGDLAALVLLALALHRLRPLGERPARIAHAAVAMLLSFVAVLAAGWALPWKGGYDLAPALSFAPPVVAAVALYSAAITLATFASYRDLVRVVELELRIFALLLGVVTASRMIAWNTADPGARVVFDIAAVVASAVAFYVATRAANDVRRVEVALAADQSLLTTR